MFRISGIIFLAGVLGSLVMAQEETSPSKEASRISDLREEAQKRDGAELRNRKNIDLSGNAGDFPQRARGDNYPSDSISEERLTPADVLRQGILGSGETREEDQAVLNLFREGERVPFAEIFQFLESEKGAEPEMGPDLDFPFEWDLLQNMETEEVRLGFQKNLLVDPISEYRDMLEQQGLKPMKPFTDASENKRDFLSQRIDQERSNPYLREVKSENFGDGRKIPDNEGRKKSRLLDRSHENDGNGTNRQKANPYLSRPDQSDSESEPRAGASSLKRHLPEW